MKYDRQPDADGFAFSSDFTLMSVANGSSVLLIDLSNKTELTLLDEWIIPSIITGTAENIIITKGISN